MGDTTRNHLHQTDAVDSMSRKHKGKIRDRNGGSFVRQPIRAHDLQPGYIVWLPASAIERGQMIRQFEYNHNVQSAGIDQALPLEALNHPAVVLEIMNLPSRESNHDELVIVAMLTSFGHTIGCEDTCRLRARGISVWDSYLAIHPSTHPSNTDVLYLQKGKLDKPSYVGLTRTYVPVSAIKTYTRGHMARASDLHLTSTSLGIVFRKLGMKAPKSCEREPGVDRETTTIPHSPSLPVISTQGSLFTPHRMPNHHQILVPNDIWARSFEPGPSVSRGALVMPSSPSLPVISTSDTPSAAHKMPYHSRTAVRKENLVVPNTRRLYQPALISYTSGNYGSIDTRSLPPPITWSPRGRTSKVSRIFNLIGRHIPLSCFKVALWLSVLGLIVFFIPWASIGSIFTKIGYSLASVWFSCWRFIANGWSSFVAFSRNSWHTLISWLKGLFWK